MEVKASLKYLRIAPRKMRLVTESVKGLPVTEAEAQLKFNKKQGAEPVLKLLKSAVSNAEHNFQLKKENLYIKLIRVNEGPSLKRWRPRARGSAYPIKKRTSHLDLILAEKVPTVRSHQPETTAVSSHEETPKVKPKEEKPKQISKIPEKQVAPKQVLPKQKIFRRKAI